MKLKVKFSKSLFCFALLLVLCLPIITTQEATEQPRAKAIESDQLIIYEEDFNDVTGAVDLVPGVNYSSTSAGGWVYGAKSANGSAKVQDGKLYFSGSAYDVIYRDGGQTWGNYTLEADFCYTSDNSGWGGMLYNVQSEDKFQKVGIATDGMSSANGHDGKVWTNDSATHNKYNMKNNPALKIPKVNEPFRMRVEVENKTAKFSYAMIENGVAGEFISLLSISNIPANAQTGSIGFMTSNGKFASYWVDNIKCYSSSLVSYTENFDSYGDVALTANALHSASGINYVRTYSTGTADIKDGKLVLNGGGSAYDMALFTMSKNWTNYSVEADVKYLAKPTGWMGILYRSTDNKNFQKAVVSWDNRGNLNGKYNGNWYKNNEGTALIDYDGGITIGVEFRLRVVADENSAKLYLAHYDENGNLGDWTYVMGHENNFADVHLSGMIGFIVGGATTRTCHASIDNIVVYRGADRMTKAPTPANVADIYQPDSGIVNPPVVVQRLTQSLPAKTGERPAVALTDIDKDMNVLSATGETLSTVSEYIDEYRDSLIPAFIVDSEEEAEGMAELIKEKNLIDCYVVASSANASLVKQVRLANPVTAQISGALIFDDLNDASARKQARALVADNMSYVAISKTLLSEESARYFNLRQVAAWSFISDKAGVYSGIACGYHGIIAEDCSVVYDVYESITLPTVSGKPIIVAHRGANLAVNYPENTIMGYTAAIEEYGADALEIDVRITKDGYLYLMHDAPVDRTTNGTGNGANFTLAELKNLVVDEVAGKETEVPTFEELLKIVSGTDIVLYCHINIQTDINVASFMHLVDKYDCKDNVLFFISNTAASNYNSNTTRVASNTAYDLNGAPVVTDGIVYTAGDADVLSGKGSELYGVEAMRGNINPYNYQPLFYKYANKGAIWGTESFYYQMSARGFVNSHSITDGQTVMDETALTKSGAVGFLTDDLDLCDDYHYAIDVSEQRLLIGSVIELKHTLKMTKGAKEVECNFLQIDGDTLVATDNGYTLTTPGVAKLVFYATRTTDGGTTYTVYSQPVTITFVDHSYVKQDGEKATCTTDGVKEHYTCLNCDKLFVLIDGSYEQVTEDDLVIKAGHSLVDVTEKSATCTDDGYTAHKACENCDYTEGKQVIPAEHKPELVQKTEATCTTDGVKEHYECLVCDKLFVLIDGSCEQVTKDDLVIKAGHEYKLVAEASATTEKEGVKEHYECLKCNGLYLLVDGEYVEVSESDLVIAKLQPSNPPSDTEKSTGCPGSAMELLAMVSMLCEIAFMLLMKFHL